MQYRGLLQYHIGALLRRVSKPVEMRRPHFYSLGERKWGRCFWDILARGVAVRGLEVIEVTAAELEVLPEVLLTDDFVLR